MTDKFQSLQAGGDAPAEGGFTVTKSDVTVFAQPTRALWVGGAGDVAARMLDQTTVTFVGVPAGTLLPVRVDKVLSTGTSATSIVGIY
jgi:hypothetical protein